MAQLLADSGFRLAKFQTQQLAEMANFTELQHVIRTKWRRQQCRR